MKNLNTPKKILAIVAGVAFVVACSQKTAPVVTEEAEPYTGPKITYAADVAPIIKRSCSPCHFPSDGGGKEAFETYGQVKDELAHILERVQLPKDNWRFMPKNEKKPALSAAEIEMLKNWARGGFIES